MAGLGLGQCSRVGFSSSSSLAASFQPQQAPRQLRVSSSCLTPRAEAAQTSNPATINPAIKKEVDKVVDTVLVAELAKPLTPYCRCWRSGTFPLCDGSHAKHNKETGDNVGPLLIKK